MKTFGWLLKREIWEHRSFVIVPLVIGGLAILFMLLGFLKAGHIDGIEHFSEHIRLNDVAPEKRHLVTSMIIMTTAIPFSIVILIVVAVYLLDALYGDRRDRSILFWKSLPVSDASVVLSKLATATLVAPLITLVVVAATQLVALLLVSIGFLLLGIEGWSWLWNPLGWFRGWSYIAYGYLALSLVLLPYMGWFLLASSWARRTPFLWAVVPPVALVILERWFLGSQYLAKGIFAYLGNTLPAAFPASNLKNAVKGHAEGVMPNFALISEPSIWIGLLFAALFITGAIWLRRYRDEI